MEKMILGVVVAISTLAAGEAMACDCVGNRTKHVLDVVSVPSDGTATYSTFVPQTGNVYFMKASGTYSYWYRPADAECSYRPAESYGPGWVLGEDVFPQSWSVALDVLVDGTDISWGSTCNEYDHTYVVPYVGQGHAASFSIWDSYYGDNSGNISVELYECL
ncbi:hypothetical protein WMF38_19155 [Sorangium sp. So ce118]